MTTPPPSSSPLVERVIVDAMRGEREEYWRDPSETRTAISDEDYARAIVAYLSRAGYVLVERALVVEAAEVSSIEKERDHWKANHDCQRDIKRAALVRADLPIEEHPERAAFRHTMARLEAERDAARAEVERLRRKLDDITPIYEKFADAADAVFQPMPKNDYRPIVDHFLLAGDCKAEGIVKLGKAYVALRADRDALAAQVKALGIEKSAVRHYLSCALGYDGSHPELAEDLTILARQVKAMAEMALAEKRWPTSARASAYEQMREERDALAAKLADINKTIAEVDMGEIRALNDALTKAEARAARLAELAGNVVDERDELIAHRVAKHLGLASAQTEKWRQMGLYRWANLMDAIDALRAADTAEKGTDHGNV